ncbi:MAG: PAS domain S-box protein [Gallionella sp.]|jgi:diguanylate cyclase (GGDEF)-like protein/PAS domain S-box-containing protein
MAVCAVSQGNIKQNMLLIDIATLNVVHLAPADSVGKAGRLMAEKRISSLIVTDEESRPVGIVTERNILHAMQSGRSPETSLQKIMSSPVITVQASMTCLDAYQLCLQDGIRHLVIVDDEKRLIGVVSETDFRLHISLAELAGRRQIAAVMSRSVFSLALGASLREALDIMQLHRDTCVVVVEEERPVGIVTERDVVRLYCDNSDQTDIPVGVVMTSPVLSIFLDNTINQAAELMLTARVRHLVVVDRAGRLAGLLGEHELTHAMTLGLINDKLIADGAFLHTLVNTLPDLVWLKDLEGVYLACNPRFERFFGAKEKDIVGKTDYEFVNRELAEFFREQDRKSMEKDGPSVNEEWIAYADDGHRELLETLKTPMRDSQGKLIGILGIARDITERHRAEGALRESEEKLRGLYELSPLGIALTDMNGRYIEFNEAFRKITGYPVDELKELDYWTLTPKEYEGQEAAQLASLSRLGRYGPYVKEYRQKNGNLIPIQLNGTLITGKDGKKYIWSIVEDITERKEAELQMRERELQYRTLANSGQALIWTSDTDKLCNYYNNVWLNFTGHSLEDEVGRSWTEGVHPDDVNRCVALYESAFDRRENFSMDYRLRRHDGEYRWLQDDGCPRFNSQGEFIGYIGYCLDITERKTAEENLKITASFFENTQEAILITDENNTIIDVNPAFFQITGYSREEVLGLTPKILSSGRQDKAYYEAMWQTLQQKKAWRGEIWNRRKTGEVYAELLSISVICDDYGKVVRYVGVFSDISHIKAHEAELSRIANYDALTGIPNRLLLTDRMRQSIAQTFREQNLMAVCYIDLDGFKPINDNMGHDAGDTVLVEIARRIENTIRGGDTVARLGGDEFVVLLLGLERDDECATSLERLLAAISQPLIVKNLACAVSASIGVSLYPLTEEDPDILLRHADQAMYAAKKSGGNRFHIYERTQNIRLND